MDRVAVRYIGGRPFWADNLYGTGKTWANGEVIPVPAAAARRLLVHPEFEEASESPKELATAGDEPGGPLVGQEQDDDGRDTEDDDREAVNISTMSRAELAQFAKSKYGVDIPMGAKPAMVERVRGLIGRGN